LRFRPLPVLVKKITPSPKQCWSRNSRFGSATLGRISQLFRHKVVTHGPVFNICRFDRGRLTTHVRNETAAASLAEPACISSRKLLE
jgi:hypothetical protein